MLKPFLVRGPIPEKPISLSLALAKDKAGLIYYKAS